MEENQFADLDLSDTDFDLNHLMDAQGIGFHCNSPAASPASLDQFCFNFDDDILQQDALSDVLDTLHTMNGDDGLNDLQGQLPNPSEQLSLPPLSTPYRVSTVADDVNAANVGSPPLHHINSHYSTSPAHPFPSAPLDEQTQEGDHHHHAMASNLVLEENLDNTTWSASVHDLEPNMSYAYSHQMANEPNTANIAAFPSTASYSFTNPNPPSPPLYTQTVLAMPMEQTAEDRDTHTATATDTAFVPLPPPAPFISASAYHPRAAQYAVFRPAELEQHNEADSNYRRSLFHDDDQASFADGYSYQGNGYGDDGYYAHPAISGLTSPSAPYPHDQLLSPLHATPVVNTFNTINVFMSNATPHAVRNPFEPAMMANFSDTNHNHTMNHHALAASAYITNINFVDTNNSKHTLNQRPQQADSAEDRESQQEQEQEQEEEQQVEDEEVAEQEEEEEDDDNDEDFVIQCPPKQRAKPRRRKIAKKQSKRSKSTKSTKVNPRKRTRRAVKQEEDEHGDAVQVKSEAVVQSECGPALKKQKVSECIKETKTNRECKRAFDEFVAKGEVVVDEANEQYSCRVAGCDKTYSSKPHLRRHIDEHLDRRFVCTLCGADFAQKTQAREHISNQHLGAQHQWECQYCGQAYTRYGGVKRHLVLKRCSYVKSLPHAEQQAIIADAKQDKLKDQMKR